MRNLIFSATLICICAAFISAQTETRQINGGLLNGKALSLPRPDYPEGARVAGIEGVVYVQVVIDEAGNVISAIADPGPSKVVRGGKEIVEEPAPDPIIRDAAELAAWQAKFSPTFLNGVPVRITGSIVYSFSRHMEQAVPAGLVSRAYLNRDAVSLPRPVYPPAAKAVRAEGPVSVRVTIDETGKVIAAEAISGHPLLRAAAVEAARAATFEQKVVDGKPVQVTGVIAYNFIAPKAEN